MRRVISFFCLPYNPWIGLNSNEWEVSFLSFVFHTIHALDSIRTNETSYFSLLSPLRSVDWTWSEEGGRLLLVLLRRRLRSEQNEGSLPKRNHTWFCFVLLFLLRVRKASFSQHFVTRIPKSPIESTVFVTIRYKMLIHGKMASVYFPYRNWLLSYCPVFHRSMAQLFVTRSLQKRMSIEWGKDLDKRSKRYRWIDPIEGRTGN